MSANKFDVCKGGPVWAVVTLTNDLPKPCKITGLKLPKASPPPTPGPTPYYTVPAKSGSTPGSLTITFSCVRGQYAYSADCCPTRPQPVIIVQ
jgi:hypothetical protein